MVVGARRKCNSTNTSSSESSLPKSQMSDVDCILGLVCIRHDEVIGTVHDVGAAAKDFVHQDYAFSIVPRR